jgi:hypothetical protein
MSIETKPASFIPSELMADSDAVIAHVLSRKPLDPEVYRRVRERSERITEEVRQEHGILDIAVQLVRETREEE